ncbi:MAG: O-antigen ligase family protein [Verrucomicrobiota bacterium]
MDLFALILVLVIYFLKPQEWGGILSGMHPIQIVTALVIIALLRKEGGFKIKDLFQTPHHWIVFLYFAWTIFASPTPFITFQYIQSNILFYVLAVQTLTTLPRLKTFMSWWAWLIMIVAILALLSEIGIDPLGSHDLTEGPMKGRLSLNLSMFNNPNALAHSVVPIIPMLYFLLFWKRTVMKIMVLVMFIPLLCIFLTQSKGAYLCGFVTLATTLTFGRPKAVQVLILILVATVGISALYALPRMGELNKTKSDQAIQGRVAAARFGLECMNRSWVGNGWGNFATEFFHKGPLKRDNPKEKLHHYYKAAHNAYVQNGADLGYPGLFLFAGILYCCLRTLLTAKTRDLEEERIRRILFSVVISYAVSCWMVDFFYRTALFLFAAATAALHIILSKPKGEAVVVNEAEPALPWRDRIQTALSPVLGVGQPVGAAAQGTDVSLRQIMPAGSASLPGQTVIHPVETEVAPTAATMKWKRYGVIDFALNWVLTYYIIEYWKHIIKTM